MMFQIAATTAFAAQIGTKAAFPNLNTHLHGLVNAYQHMRRHDDTHQYLELFSLRCSDPPPKTITKTYPFHYIKRLPPDPSIVSGYFQSERYFKTCEKLVRQTFMPSARILDEIRSKYGWLFQQYDQPLVSIHVRRGDYLALPKHHPVLPTDYYEKAIRCLPDASAYVVFSDDIEWCKENLHGHRYQFINDKDYLELIMMSMCTHHIICNSSFSWWGAWLNTNRNKKIVAPKTWFGSAYWHIRTADIYTNEMIVI
jgi:hypothetical protein